MIKRVEFSTMQLIVTNKRFKTKDEVIKEALRFINSHSIVSINDSYSRTWNNPHLYIAVYYKEE